MRQTLKAETVPAETFAARVAPKDDSLPKIKWRVVTASSAPASKPDGDPFEVIFVNQRRDPVKLYWMDRQGEPKPYGSIAPRKHQRQRTRPGAVWYIADSQDKPLGYFVIGDRSARGVIPKDN